MARAFPAIETLVPHRPPILLVERVLAWDEASARCEGRIASSGPYGLDGRASVVLGLEMAAQATAALEALRRQSDTTDANGDGPRIGYLTTIRDARFHVPVLPADVSLQVDVRRTGGMHPLAIYQVALSDPRNDGTPLLDATVGTFANSRVAGDRIDGGTAAP